MQELMKEIARVRNTHMKLQQTYLEIDETNIDGREITEAHSTLLDLPRDLLARNLKLASIAQRVKGKFEDFNDVDVDKLSIDSDELMPSQDEGEDGLPLSDVDSLLNGVEEESVSVTITAEKFKRVLKSARKKVITANREAILT